MAKLAICVLALLALSVEAESVSPVQKVIELLDELKAKVQGDLDREGKAMAEYSSWCDQQIGDTDYAIKTASRQIEASNAQIEESENTITAKTGEIADLGTAISTKEKELVDAESVYKGEKADSDASEKELIDSIDELSGAIVQLKKGASLVQVQKKLQPFADVLGRIVDATGVNVARKRALAGFLQSEDKEDADLTLNAPQGNVDIGGGGHSGGIMQTLEDMKAKAEGQLSDVRKAAMESKHNYDMTKMSVTQEVNNKYAQLGSATATKAATGEQLGKAKGELAETQKSKAASESLLADTKMDCEAKANEWAERQKEAGEEMGAIAKAKEILANGVKAFLQVSSKSKVVDEEDMEDEVRDRLVTVIQNLSNKYHSFALMQLTNRAK